MSTFIIDPTDREQAIVSPSGKPAAKWFVCNVADPERPLLSEIQGGTFMGFTDPDEMFGGAA